MVSTNLADSGNRGFCSISASCYFVPSICQDCEDDLNVGSKSPDVKISVEESPVPVADAGAIATALSDPQAPVMPQPPLVVGQPGLMTQPPLLHSPIVYQPPMMQPIHSIPPPHKQEQIVKEEPKGPRPVKSIPIAGTPWSVVWSSDNRRFFFNATNRTSVWNVPEDLENNPLVHKILEEIAEGKSKDTV